MTKRWNNCTVVHWLPSCVKAILEKTGLRLMTIGNTGGWRNIANTKKEIRTPNDLRGLKLRTINSPIQIELTRALGAAPTPIPWPELYIALATGTVDGSKNGLTDIIGMGFEEHIKFVTMGWARLHERPVAP